MVRLKWQRQPWRRGGDNVSIPNGSIKIDILDDIVDVVQKFQFQMVRLK